MNREKLISLCERAIVNVKKWKDRDSSDAMQNIGECWALLKAGCPFEISKQPSLKTDKDTIWLTIYFPGFSSVEDGFDLKDKSTLSDDIFYLPTEERLNEANGKDWY